MVVKLLDTVVANVTMRSSWRSKNVACLAIFELEKLVGVHIDCVIKHFMISVSRLVPPRYLLLTVLPRSGRNDSRVCTRGNRVKQIYDWDQNDVEVDKKLPDGVLLALLVEEIVGEQVKNNQGDVHEK